MDTLIEKTCRIWTASYDTEWQTLKCMSKIFPFLYFIIHITIYRSRMLEQQWQSTGSIKEIGMSLYAWVMHSILWPAWWVYSLN
jgi:hypothetical protein